MGSSFFSLGATIRTQTGYLPQRGMQDPLQQRVQPQNIMQCDLNLEGFAVTYSQRIPRLLRPEKNSANSTRPRLHQPQPQSASPRNPHRGNQQSSVLQLPEIPGNSTRPRPRQPQPQSASPRDPHLGGQMSSVPQLPEISGNSTRLRLHQPQSASPHNSHLGGKPSNSSTPRHTSRPRHKSSKSKPRDSSNPRHTSNSSNQRHTGKERQDTIRKRGNRSRYTVINIYSRHTIYNNHINYELPTQIVTDVINTSNKIDVNWSCFNLYFISLYRTWRKSKNAAGQKQREKRWGWKTLSFRMFIN